MKALRRFSARTVAAAVSPGGVWAAVGPGPLGRPSTAEVRFRPLAGWNADAGEWPELRTALAELREELDAGEASRLQVALLPPLAEARVVELPRLRRNEYRRAVVERVGRYFIGTGGAQRAVAVEPGRAKRAGTVPVFAAVASVDRVCAIRAAAEDAGWRVVRVVAGHSAWIEACRTGGARTRVSRCCLVLAGDEVTHLVRIERDRATALRRLPGTDPERVAGARVDLARDESPRSAPAIVVGEEATRERIGAALAERDMPTAAASGAGATTAAVSPGAWAAVGALRAPGPELLSEEASARRDRFRRRATVRLSIAAAALLVLAGALEFWGVHRELAAVEDRRASIRTDVVRALDRRDAIAEVDRRIDALRAVQTSSPRWSGTLHDVARRLPRDAHLVAIRGRPDSLVLEGVASTAAGVFEAFRDAPEFAGVRAEAPIERQIEEGGEAEEHFIYRVVHRRREGGIAQDAAVTGVDDREGGAADGAAAADSVTIESTDPRP